METLEQRLQREAKSYFEVVDIEAGQTRESFEINLDTLISHTISETLKEAVRVIEGRKEKPRNNIYSTKDGDVSNFDGTTYHYNRGIDTAITAVEGLMDKK